MDKLLEFSTRYRFDQFADALCRLISEKQRFLSDGPGLARTLRENFSNLPEAAASHIDIDRDKIIIGVPEDIDSDIKKAFFTALMTLCPWRKGPFELFGIDIDTEWVSSIKWNRLKDSTAPLEHRRILDIGCSSGYYMFKMASHSPEMVVGIDPFLPFYYQFLTIQKYLKLPNVFCIPAKFEEMPVMKGYFDTVFCMGILYHRISPIETLRQIKAFLRKGGELVLETLVIEGESETALFPEDRYAKMRNVFFIPTVACLTSWLKRSGFKNIKCIDTTPTTSAEQRKTDWIESESLEDFIDPLNPLKTVEGYPAPVRSILTAEAI